MGTCARVVQHLFFFSLKMNHSGAFLSQYCTNKAVFSDRGEDLVGFTDVRFRYLCSCICWMMFGLILIWLTIVHFLGWADTCCSFEGHWTEHCSLKEEPTSLCDRNPPSRFLMFSIGLINGWRCWEMRHWGSGLYMSNCADKDVWNVAVSIWNNVEVPFYSLDWAFLITTTVIASPAVLESDWGTTWRMGIFKGV